MRLMRDKWNQLMQGNDKQKKKKKAKSMPKGNSMAELHA
jgi:hypothetical protein